ncbi:MAG: type II toxin-antitoxin system VapC family toxin [Acidobacteriaceae bacterium]|jgi:predicted nucleic-acid-binding protein|nr:type II toxin-antitoxin system VapC family toxin [Acidobacteriaceae bacterium]
MRAIDTNVLVRLLVRDDARQLAAAEEFVAPGAWVSLVTLVETTWVLASVYALEADAIALAVDMLLNHRQLTVQDAETVAAALEDYRRKPAVGFSDCLILSTARKAGHIPLGTFDRNLARLENAKKL